MFMTQNITFSDEYFMKKAFDEAQIAFDKGEIPVGAIVVCNNKIVAKAHNLVETLNDVTAHAEILAISSAAEYLGGKYLPECTIYITLEPCVMCSGALQWAQIGRVVYGAKDETRGYNKNAPNALHKKTKITSGILEEECSNILKEFFSKKR